MRRFCRRCRTELARDNCGELCAACGHAARDLLSAPPEVPAGFWEAPPMRRALARRHMGEVVRAFRGHAHHGRPIPQAVAASWFHLTQTQLSRIENGPPPKDLDRLARWAQTLRIPPRLLWFALPGTSDSRPACYQPGDRSIREERRTSAERLPLPVPEDGDPLVRSFDRDGRRVGHETVVDLRGHVHRLRLADDVLAGGDLVEPATRELDVALRLYRDGVHAESTGRELLGVVGELAQICGWIVDDAGFDERAVRIYWLGVRAAREARDSTLASNVLGSLAYQRSNIGDPHTGVTLANAALDEAGDDAPPRARALCWDRLAWAYAMTRRPEESIRALDEAGRAFGEYDHEQDPPYLYWVDARELRIMEARVYTELRRPLRAIPLLTELLDGYDRTHAREVALYLSWLAIALADANEPEEAARTAGRMLELSAGLPSERTAERSRVVLARLESFYDVAEVRSLFDACRDRTSDR